MKTRRVAVPCCSRPPLAAAQHPVLLVIVDRRPTAFANVDRFLRLTLRPLELRKLQNLKLSTARAGDEVLALVTILVSPFNAALPADSGSGCHENLPTGESASSRQREIHRIPFAVDITGIGIHF